MQFLNPSAIIHPPLAFFVLNLDPIFLHVGPISIHWYGLMYVVAISVALWVLLRYTKRLGIHENQIWGVFVYAAIAGLIGGRLYYVIQQPDLVSHYLLDPINIFSVWNGGMAFFGAIFLASLTVFVMAPRYGVSRWVAIDGGAMFAAVGQIFGRFGNIVNGDILGKVVSASPTIPASVCAHAPCLAYVSDRHILAWAIVYLNPQAFAATHVAYQP
ncbi:MAG TPA: prolipoprotein diacylglyceryl transferase family protein, partial [Ktedonobacterales bacterium]|nr:prolipoprotein diacylglyceryl transferase family protein [Ktedonobacterales bacterium]